MSRLHLDHETWTESLPGVWVLGPTESGDKLRRPVRATNVLLQGPSDSWWIDAGPHALSPPFTPQHGLLTHSHPDHFYGIPSECLSRFWLSHTNRASWEHEAYVAQFWQQYRDVCDLGAGLDRLACIDVFPSLAHLKDAVPGLWTEHLLEAIRLRYRELHPTHPDLSQTRDLEALPLAEVVIHGHSWLGWDLGDLVVIPTRGHAPDHVVAYWRPAQLWIVGDELSAVPVWLDSDAWASAAFRTKLATALPDEAWLVGGHQSTLWRGALARQTLLRTNQIWDAFHTKLAGCRQIDQAYVQWIQAEPMHPILRRQVPHTLLFAKQFMANIVLRSAT